MGLDMYIDKCRKYICKGRKDSDQHQFQNRIPIFFHVFFLLLVEIIQSMWIYSYDQNNTFS